MNDAWKIVVEPAPRKEAEETLRVWLDSQAKRGIVHRQDEVREDVILSKDRLTLVRFLVKSS